MRVGVITYGLDRRAFGVSRSIVNLGRALSEHPDCAPVFITPYRRGPFANDRWSHVQLRASSRLPGLMSVGALQLPLLAKHSGFEVIHDPAGISPFLVGRWGGSYKRVVTLHDATAFRFPETHALLTRIHDRHYVPTTLRNVDAVITDSDASRRDLMHFLGVPETKLHVVPLAADAEFKPVDSEAAAAVAERYGLKQPYVLYFGALEPRKNVPALLRAFARLRKDFPDLILALGGSPRWKYSEIPRTVQELDLGSSARFIGYVADADLPAVYSAAAVFCYPSLYEGFGLPVLEAMACGVPVVCSNLSSLPEIVGDAGLLVTPDELAVAEGIGKVLVEHRLAASLRERGLARASEFSWARSAGLTVDVYRRVLGQR